MKKIAVVEDDSSIAQALRMILEDMDYRVRVFSEGDEALKKIKKYTPDLVLLDMLMSGVDGCEICQAIKSDEKLKKIKVVMISAHPNAEKRVFESGADDFVAKPFDVEKILKVISYNLSPT